MFINVLSLLNQIKLMFAECIIWYHKCPIIINVNVHKMSINMVLFIGFSFFWRGYPGNVVTNVSEIRVNVNVL